MTTTSERLVDVKFKVAMDSEAKAAGKFHEVEFKVNMAAVSQEVVDKMAISAQVVRWQGEIRSHWDEFLKGELPKVAQFGTPLFGTSRTRIVKAAVTDDDVKMYLEKLSPAMKLQKTIEMMEEAGMDIPPELLEKLDFLTDQEEVEADKRKLEALGVIPKESKKGSKRCS